MIDLISLQSFLKHSAAHTYAGDGKEVAPQRPGFTELEYREGDWYMRDSYVGHYQAPGMTIVYFQDTPVWTCAYGGQVLKKFYKQTPEVFGFLKKALTQQDRKLANILPVRGPSEFTDNAWKYTFAFDGDMTCFSAKEKIFLSNELCFFQDVFGGLVIPKV